MVDPDGMQVDDWVRLEGDTEFFWDEDVNSEQDAIDRGYIYGGKTIRQAKATYKASLGFFQRLFGSSPDFNFDSYLRAKYTPIANCLLRKAASGYKEFYINKSKVEREKIDDEAVYGFYPIQYDDIKIPIFEISEGSYDEILTVNGKYLLVTISIVGTVKSQSYSNHVRFLEDGANYQKMTIFWANGGGRSRLGINFTNNKRGDTGVLWIQAKSIEDYRYLQNSIYSGNILTPTY